MKGSYTRDFYFIPTILLHNGDGIYYSIEIAWLKWYVGFAWNRSNRLMKEKER